MQEQLRQAIDALEGVLRDKSEIIRLALTALLARGHLLVEDGPGLGKTTLARALAAVLGMEVRRIQFTSDLLPSDVTGVSIFDPRSGSFCFREGPVFANIVLADELNRAGPKTQSALLEAMSEGTVTSDNATRPLPSPFMVIATQNPLEHHGTYPLPDSDLDRFLLRIEIGYPSREAERQLVLDRRQTDPLNELSPVVLRDGLAPILEAVKEISVSDAVMDYMLDVVEASRNNPALLQGVSPRGTLMWYRAVQACAYLEGRDYAIPDDPKAVAVPALAHRIVPLSSNSEGQSASRIVRRILETTPVRV